MILANLLRAVRRSAAESRNLAADDSGATAVSVAVMLTVLMGFVGLGIDIGYGYNARRQLQNAADSAAYSAAVSVSAGESRAPDQARAVAGRYGLVHGQDGIVINVNTPPASGPNAGRRRAVEVVIERPIRRFFSRLFVSGDQLVRARAVARVSPAANACVVALNSTADASALDTGSADIRLAGCSLFSNSTSASAVQLKGSASLTADSIGAVGGYTVGSNATLTTANGVHTGERAVDDPYEDVPIPPYSGCTYNGATLASGTYGSGSGTPTVFCNGLQINSGVTVTLNPGIYIVDRGSLRVNGGATLRGNGVTIVLTSSTGSDYATLQLNGQSTVDLTAPTSGPTAGLVIYQDRRAPAGVTNVLNGGSTQSLQGAVYFPNQIVTFTGGSSTSSGCTQLLASEVAFRGNSSLGLNCSGIPIRRITGVFLVE